MKRISLNEDEIVFIIKTVKYYAKNHPRWREYCKKVLDKLYEVV